MPRLVQLVDGVASQKFPLEQDRLTLGRAPDNDVVLDDLAVSAHHAVVERLSGPDGVEFRLRDLDSTNGSFVNDAQIQTQCLHNRDVVRIGWVYLEFVDDSAELEKTTQIRRTWLPGVFISRK